MTLYRRQGSRPIPTKKKCKKAKWLSEEESCEKKGSEKQRGKGKIYPFECRVPRIVRRDKKAFLSDQLQRNRGKQ